MISSLLEISTTKFLRLTKSHIKLHEPAGLIIYIKKRCKDRNAKQMKKWQLALQFLSPHLDMRDPERKPMRGEDHYSVAFGEGRS